MMMLKTLVVAGLLSLNAGAAFSGEPFIPNEDDLSMIEDGLKARLLDPESIIVSEVIATEDVSGPALVWVCGKVRGKNSFGGYAQPTPFMGTFVTGKSGKRSFLTMVIAGPSDDEQLHVLETCLAKF